jgi:hypothetical protein
MLAVGMIIYLFLCAVTDSVTKQFAVFSISSLAQQESVTPVVENPAYMGYAIPSR